MTGRIFSYIILSLWIFPATGQGGYDLPSYVHNSEFIVCGTIVSADTSYLNSTDPSRSQSVIAKMKVQSKLKGLILSDTIKIQYFPIDYLEHVDPPELRVDSLYLGFMKYNSQYSYYQPTLYDPLCFSSISLAQIPPCVLIVNDLFDSNLDSCTYFDLLMVGVKANLLLAYRSLHVISSNTRDPQTSYCIEESTTKFLYTLFCQTTNTLLLEFTGDYYVEEIDSVLINLISPRLQYIDESIDLYALDDKLAVYDYIEHLSFIKDNIENKSKLGILYDYIFTAKHSEFTNFTRELISTNRR